LKETIYRVLVAEDDHDTQKLLEDIFTQRREVELVGIVSDGLAALETLQGMSEMPDIVVLDHHMPQLNGLETAARIRELSTEIKILMMSADAAIRESARSHGFKNFIQKPHPVSDLVETVVRIAGEAKSRPVGSGE